MRPGAAGSGNGGQCAAGTGKALMDRLEPGREHRVQDGQERNARGQGSFDPQHRSYPVRLQDVSMDQRDRREQRDCSADVFLDVPDVPQPEWLVGEWWHVFLLNGISGQGESYHRDAINYSFVDPVSGKSATLLALHFPTTLIGKGG